MFVLTSLSMVLSYSGYFVGKMDILDDFSRENTSGCFIQKFVWILKSNRRRLTL